MSDTGYYPPEYGMEGGETCWRGGCRGRMVEETEEVFDDYLEDEIDPVEPVWIVYCGTCGVNPYDD